MTSNTSVEYKHIVFNQHLQNIQWAIEMAGDGWELIRVVLVDSYNSVAVFQKGKVEPPVQEGEL